MKSRRTCSPGSVDGHRARSASRRLPPRCAPRRHRGCRWRRTAPTGARAAGRRGRRPAAARPRSSSDGSRKTVTGNVPVLREAHPVSQLRCPGGEVGGDRAPPSTARPPPRPRHGRARAPFASGPRRAPPGARCARRRSTPSRSPRRTRAPADAPARPSLTTVSGTSKRSPPPVNATVTACVPSGAAGPVDLDPHPGLLGERAARRAQPDPGPVRLGDPGKRRGNRC